MRLHRSEIDPSSRLIIEEAERRGIAYEILAPRAEYFRLRYGERTLVCRESLSELTSAVALSRCDDKRTTRHLLREAGLSTPEQVEAGSVAANEGFLREVGSVVVKPARGEQGRGISVGVTTAQSLQAAIERAAEVGRPVLIEQCVRGEDLRLVVIDHQLVAAATRRPPQVTGDGRQTLFALIEQESQRRYEATDGAGSIPIDAETGRCLEEAGYSLADVLPAGKTITVRGTANVHQGGTIRDVTRVLHPALVDIAARASRALDIPVVGLDLIVPALDGPKFWIIEANERPGLANHEPQPTAARFVDLLFPETKVRTGDRRIHQCADG
ncbi:MAG: ATP-grasp domain-containing protein [Polyangiaceae bacterium]|nr:ATP-grasp domain-containing protein [Polyangiaceae bacterium]